MSVVAERHAPSDGLVLDDAAAAPGLTVDLERVVPSDGGPTPFAWTGRGDRGFEAVVADDPTVAGVTLLDDFDAGRLFRIERGETSDGLVDGVRGGDGAVLRAVSRDVEWFCKPRFDDRSKLGGFQRRCDDRGVAFAPLRLYACSARSPNGSAGARPARSGRRSRSAARRTGGGSSKPSRRRAAGRRRPGPA